MSNYRRSQVPGGPWFFTVTLADRQSRLLLDEIALLRHSYRQTQRARPFNTLAICILPDHLHAIWTLPDGGADFAGRWSLLKSSFSR
jgi:putative transposase